MNTPAAVDEEQTFVETALKLGGKSDEEARKTGSLDRADENVEALFAPRYQTANSPIHRAVWDDTFPLGQFQSEPVTASAECQKVVDRSLEAARKHRQAGTLYGSDGVISDALVADLSQAGYWGMLVPKEYGGVGAPIRVFCNLLTRMIPIEATVAGWASIHGGVGAVDPLRTFGTEQQRKQFLPLLASGERISGFALTEPGAGSDLTNLKTTARLDGDDYVVNGEKLFITNVICGRMVGLVVLIDNVPSVLIVDLPKQESENFSIVRYKLSALHHSNNNGLKFKDFRVPKQNLIVPPKGNGLSVAYHGLNNGRVALCAMASGGMRAMLANMIPWSHYRVTYGQPIGKRELVRRRMGRLASMIVAADALVEWCAWLLDTGYRGEMECIIAKIFGSESQKEAAIELLMKTHGGRSFLVGHIFSDNVHEYLAPCIYEGEGEMLGMAFFKSLIKEHGTRYFEPIGRTLHARGIRDPNLANPAHLWALRQPMLTYGKWLAKERVAGPQRVTLPSLPPALAEHAQFAADGLQKARLEISAVMRKYQLKLADRQVRIAELSQRVQDLATMLVTALYASRQKEEVTRLAGDVLCQSLANKLLPRRPSDRFIRDTNRLGEMVAEGGFTQLTGIDAEEILMPYER